MIKLLLSIATILLISINTYAQQTTFEGGVKVGASYPILSNEAESTNASLGYAIGFFGHYNLKSDLSVGSEVYYDVSKFTNDEIDTEIKMNNINIPLYLKKGLGSGISAFLGGELSILIDSEINMPDYGTINTNEYYNKTNFAFLAGFGYDINNVIGLDLRYTNGLTSITDLGTGKLSRFAFNINIKF